LNRLKNIRAFAEKKTKREIKDEAFDKTIIGIRKNLKIIQSEFVEKGLPVVVEFIEKRWQEGTVSYKRSTWPNIDALYEK
jgi:hypothetical protein